ncbi:MAG: BatA domain-containing protein, partial [Gemmatimonadota bacterium]
MTWQNPWGWAGLAAIALPIAIHLLGQGRAVRQRFPTLRFFGATRPLPTTRTRLHELLLLAIRCAILAAAAAALAQPVLQNSARRSTADSRLVRAVIIDNSASMQRMTASGEPAVAEAMRRAQQVGDSADARVLLPANDVTDAIPGALAW